MGDISFAVRRGERVGVVGADGAGKTTLLQMLAGILDPSSGDCRVFGLDTRRESKIIAARIGYMSQGFTLYDRLSVDENLAFSARIRDVPQDQYLARRNSLLQMAGLTTFTQRPAGKLSGGMRKRAGFARALVLNPDVVLFDEPDSGLDPVRTSLLNDLILDVHAEHGGTYVLVTHNIPTARKVSDYVALVWQGKRIHYGPTEEAFESEDAFVRQFLSGDSAGPLGMD